MCLSIGGGSGVHTRDGIVCNEFHRSMTMTMRTRKKCNSGGGVEFRKGEMWRRREKGRVA